MKLLPTLKQMEYLVALADEVHFGRAAEVCHVTPSTLSAGIKELETLLGVPLAERTKRTVFLTPLGKEIAARGRDLLRDAEDIMALAAAGRRAPLTGPLHLGVIPTVGPYLLPRVLPTLWQCYPDLQLFLREEKTDDLLANLRQGDLDAAIVALPYDIDGLEALELFEDPFVFACAQSHPRGSAQRVGEDALKDGTMLLLEEGHCLRGHALDACHLDRQEINRNFEATSLHTLVQMVAANLGVTLLPQLAVDGGIVPEKGLVLVPLDGAPSRRIGLVWRKSSQRSEEFRLLGEGLKPP